MSWKPAVQTAGNGDKWGYNALAFATKEEAEMWAKDLMFRWTAVSDYAAHESAEEVTHVINEMGEMRNVGYVEAKP
jgi:hypothetical protein